MFVDPQALRSLLDKANFKEHGDGYEKNFSHVVLVNFPNCERFWGLFIVPLTNRINGYPDNLGEDFRFREGLTIPIEEISLTHYSAFLNLVYAHQHLSFDRLSSLEDLYVHLGCACDLVETFLEKSYMLLLQCRGQQTRVLDQLTKKEFLAIAEEWYDNSYPIVHGYYLSKGKHPPLKLPKRGHLLKEFIADYLRHPALWREYQSHSKAIREFRNVIVHDVQIGKAVSSDGFVFIPKPSLIQNYRTLRQFFAAVGNEEILRRDFSEADKQAYQDLTQLESILNNIWQIVLQEFLDEFYSVERSTMRELYAIEFS